MGYIVPISISLVCSSTVIVLTKYFGVNKFFNLTKYLQFRKFKLSALPKLPEKFWRPGTERLATTNVQPYQVIFPEQDINDLKDRLKRTRYPSLKDLDFENIDDIENNYTNTDILQGLLYYWANNYNFEERLKLINKYSHFKTNIQGLDIHFVHVKPDNPEGKRVLPLLILHGWPSSIMEFYKTIPLLTTPRSNHDFVFEVIIPSLPGFGFSNAPSIPGFSCAHMSVVLKNLMIRLGHDKFYVQGNDWSAVIVRIMSSLFPQHVLGMHSNLCTLLDKQEVISSYLSLTKTNQGVMSSKKSLMETEYFTVHATNPDTTGIGLNDSPAAMAAYIIEKYFSGSNYSNNNMNEFITKYTYDEMIDNVMIYWASKSIVTAIKIYTEQFTELDTLEQQLDSTPVNVPSAFSQFVYKMLQPPIAFRKRFNNLLGLSYMHRNGRFPAMEDPAYFANDIWGTINDMETWNVSNKENMECI